MSLGVIQLLFGSTDVTFLLLNDGNLTFDKNINQRWTCSFYLQEPPTGTVGANRPVVGQPFTLKEDGSLRFTGFIDTILEVAMPSTNVLQYQCQCSSWAEVCDRNVCTAEYDSGEIAFNVIQDIVNRFLVGDGITITTNVDGSTLLTSPLVFNPATVTDAFNQIRDQIGRQWWVDENKDLHFQIVGLGLNSGIVMQDNDGSWLSGTMQVTTTSANFRNVQYVQTGVGLGTASRTDTFTIASPNDFFLVTKFKLNAAPTVTVNGVAQSVFEFGVDPFGQNGWYWFNDGYGVQQGQQIAPPIGSIVQVTYAAQTVNYAVVQDNASIASRAAIEGDSGIWGQVTNQNNITDLTVATSYASGLLAAYEGIPQQVQFQTYKLGFILGQKVQMIINLHNLNGFYTVMEVQATEVPGASGQLASGSSLYGGTFLYTITVNNQAPMGNYIQWFTGLVNSLKPTISAFNVNPTPTTPATPAGIEGIVEEPIGVKNGSNTVFAITHIPVPPCFWLFLNGVEQSPFVQPSPELTADYTLSGQTITFRVAPKSTDEIFVEYFIGLTGGTTRTGQARKYALSTDVVNWGTGSQFNLHADMSLGIWVNMSSSASGTIISRGLNGALQVDNDAFSLVVAGSSGAWNINYNHHNGVHVSNTLTFVTALKNDTWYYIGFTRDSGAKTVTMYTGNGLTLTTIGTQSYANNPDGGTAATAALQVGNHA